MWRPAAPTGYRPAVKTGCRFRSSTGAIARAYCAGEHEPFAGLTTAVFAKSDTLRAPRTTLSTRHTRWSLLPLRTHMIKGTAWTRGRNESGAYLAVGQNCVHSWTPRGIPTWSDGLLWPKSSRSSLKVLTLLPLRIEFWSTFPPKTTDKPRGCIWLAQVRKWGHLK